MMKHKEHITTSCAGMKTTNNFFTGRGSLIYADNFVSIRLLKEALVKKYRLTILEESASHIKCKIIRYARLYGAPILFPNPTLTLIIKKESGKNILYYDFQWPEYYLVAVLSVLAGITSRNIILFLLVFIFFGGFVFLDTKWVSSRIRKIISTL